MDSQTLVSKDLININTTTYYLYGLDLISQGGTASTSREYYLTDGQGNVRYITDHTGAVTASFTYDPYGNVVAASGTAETIFGFQTQQQDVQSGLTYLRARYYDSSTGRFTSQDPFPGFAEDPTGQN